MAEKQYEVISKGVAWLGGEPVPVGEHFTLSEHSAIIKDGLAFGKIREVTDKAPAKKTAKKAAKPEPEDDFAPPSLTDD